MTDQPDELSEAEQVVRAQARGPHNGYDGVVIVTASKLRMVLDELDELREQLREVTENYAEHRNGYE